jgi:hypothetical protein
MVSFVGFEKPAGLLGRGYLAGKWAHNRFRGKWIGIGGKVKGLIAGCYGVRKDGKKVFFGKYVDTTGKFKGVLRGVWGDKDPNTPGGYFKGHWIDASGEIAGFLGGHWIDAPNKVGGFFRGIYTVRKVGDPDDRDDEDKNTFPGDNGI